MKYTSMICKKYRIIFLIIGALALLGFLLFSSKSTSNEIMEITAIDESPAIVQNAEIITIKKEPSDVLPFVPSSVEGEELYLVKRVKDGDTIELENGETVRYIGIDTPESVHPQKPVQCFGVEASQRNKELVEGKLVRLERDITDRDKYGRLLRYIYAEDGTFINFELVKQGYASVYTYPPDVKYNDLFLEAQKEARENNSGLWSACQDENYEIPAISNESNQNDPACQIKGNINSTGEKIYHLPNCSSYNKTKIDEARGEKWFCSEDEALDAGWRKALNCL
ncbi:hypothetical protein A2824_01940 [Candidatus Nomurabacteria bacterium RIFCSPHIGHO2_01_FULL_42_16]|uniref:TNase-like domain-containing protein n=1 Tax=Candidatus Nomurabacteria bacterium RIFCSPHIGHO2_01_FULL_42_16 TaxID=1801743 RepID=A0A1F6VHU4_9BACT|nr:MAG: hypothetical protein A2824_01940 [Candidatus Nomurabacteria bacterium RIFCSPHIGHO2_01_FULL_42_16]